MRRTALVVVVAACGGGGHEPPPPTGPITAHVTHYDYTIDLASRAAHATVTAAIDTGGDCWTVPLRAQAPANVMLDGVAASASAANDQLVVCGTGYPDGDTLVLDADVTIADATLDQSQVGFSTRNDKQGNPFTYLVSWVDGCDQFAPCDNRPDAFATYHFDVTHDPSLTVRCPGTIREDSPSETECDVGFDGAPTYSTFGIAAFPAWTQTDLGTWGGVHVTLYDNAATGIAAQIVPAYHDGYLAWLESEFGPYPYGSELRLLTAPTYWNGFEHPGNIVLNDTLATQTTKMSGYTNTTEHVIDHEMTHMWAGDQTTLSGTYDFAWKESMAEYLAYVWEDMQDPTVGTQTAQAWKTFGTTSAYWPVPTDSPQLIDYYSDVYGPGPMVLFRQLEVMSSRAAVLSAIQSVLGHPHFLSVDDLLAALQQATGIDLTAYKQAWIAGSGAPAWPRLDLTFTAGSGATSTLAIVETNPAATPRTCKFHVALLGDTTDEVETVAVDATAGITQTLQVPTPAFTVTSIFLDPQRECLVYPDTVTARQRPRIEPWVADPERDLAQ
ncbi:MAG TPA: M1 family aminopeptidase [Kofleriaceae bacterium]|nr:M1 family aminopeptidase [Kofleriaceae bacterium]